MEKDPPLVSRPYQYHGRSHNPPGPQVETLKTVCLLKQLGGYRAGLACFESIVRLFPVARLPDRGEKYVPQGDYGEEEVE